MATINLSTSGPVARPDPSCATQAEPDRAGAARPLRLRLLGGFALLRGTEEIVLPMSAQRLVALLALRDRPLSRAYLAGVLWSEYSAQRSAADLRTALWRANHCRAPSVSAVARCLLLRADIQVDVRALLASARLGGDGAANAARQVAEMSWFELSHDLLPDWYDEWLVDDRESIRQLRLHALEGLADELSRRGRHADAIQAALAAIRLEPLRETSNAALIRAHLAEGNRSEALRQFCRFKDVLAAELSVEPSDRIQRLFSSPVLLPWS
jgi:DNA-binding SARP family transcriptional activator